MENQHKDFSEEKDLGSNNAQEIDNQNEENQKEAPGAQEGKASSTDELAKIKAELEEANNKYLRLYAEFDNFKRRISKERVELLQTAGKEVIADMLTVLDDFDRALKAIENTNEIAPIKEGVELVHHKLKSTLSKKGLKEMQAIGSDFDPEVHEAVTKIPSPTPDMEGKIIDQVEKGYYLNDKVLRHAKVVVGG
ncbi:nucleotide exchange factor GrpE [Olivibacter sitiensis]|uniref:nucleotide exchange factor GrpE n=1 Tax=Olivibacter sitiensis TaxID=376470 RepID=UPI00041377DB|nr:nucleotide exchange factor GrpE [Olivibacter sitiensis]